MEISKICKASLTAVVLSLVMGTTVIAAEKVSALPADTANKSEAKAQDHGKCMGKHNRFLHTSLSILKNKHGVTAEDINKAKTDGKTVYDLAKTKGVAQEQFKTSILAPKLKALDEAVNTGEMTKDKAETIKSKMKADLDAWDGKITDMKAPMDMKDQKGKMSKYKLE